MLRRVVVHHPAIRRLAGLGVPGAADLERALHRVDGAPRDLEPADQIAALMLVEGSFHSPERDPVGEGVGELLADVLAQRMVRALPGEVAAVRARPDAVDALARQLLERGHDWTAVRTFSTRDTASP